MTSLKLNPADQLPPEIFVDIVMFKVGSRSIKDLMTCRLVCKEWKEMIRDSLWENPSKKWGTIIGRRFEDSWRVSLPAEEKICKVTELLTKEIISSAVMKRLAKKVKESLANVTQDINLIKCAASLAHKGLLGPVKKMWLCGDLTSVPAEHMMSLVSSVTRCFN